jgi:hypothetical protein
MSETNSELLRKDIIDAMTKIEDVNYRVTLAMVLRMLDSQEGLIHRLFEKVDTLIADEKRLQRIVLNGHVDDHNDHHKWIQEKIDAEEDFEIANKTFFRGTMEKAILGILIFLVGFHYQKIVVWLSGG